MPSDKITKKKKKVKKRKWLPTFADLIDRMSIHQLKEVFIPEYKDKYRKEMSKMSNDLDILCEEYKVKLDGKLIRSIIVLAQINEHIWYNESSVRSGIREKQDDLFLLRLTHGLNGIRNQTMNYILDIINKNDRHDYKTDCLAAEFSNWEINLDLDL